MKVDEVEISELKEAERFCIEGERYLPVEKQAIIEGWKKKNKRIEEVHFWRRIVVRKNEEIEGLRIWYNEWIDELLKERVENIIQIKQLIEEKEGLKREFERMKEEREKLEERVTKLFEEAEDVKGKKKVKKAKEKREKKRPGAKRGHKGWYRPIPENIDEIIEETLSICPHCGSSELSRCEKVEEHVMEDIVPARLRVTLYRQHYYWCKGCKRTVTKKSEVIKNGRIGPNAISYATKLKHDMKLPYEKVSELFNTLCGLKVTGGGLAQLLERNSKKVEGISEAIIERIKHSSFVHGDETGWRILSAERINQWLMCFCNIEAVYYEVVGHRNSEEVRKILGEKIDGVFISDFCSCYNKLIAKKQRCLVHVLRDIKNYLEEDGCDSLILTQLKEGIGEIIEEGLKLQKDAGTGTALGLAWQLNRQLLTERLEGLCRLQSEDDNARRLIKRLNRFKDEVLTFADYPPQIEYHNNRAERMLRPMVVSRKISYGSQTEKGAKATCIMMSILQTCQLRGVDFRELIRDAITGRVPEWRLSRRLLGISRSPP